MKSLSRTVRTAPGVSIHVRLDAPLTPAAYRVVLLHAAGGSSASWDLGFIAFLVDRQFQVLRLDLRDSGRSTYGAPSYGVGDLATDVITVMQEMGWENAAILGAGAGAAVAEQVARAQPRRCNNLVLVSPLQADRAGISAAVCKPQAEVILRVDAFGRTGVASDATCHRYLMQLAVTRAGSATDPGAASQVAAAVLEHAADLPRQLTILPGLPLQISSTNAATVTCPVLVVCGSEDPVLPIDQVVTWLKDMPTSRLLVLAGAGHADLPPNGWQVVVDAMDLQAYLPEG